LDEEAAVRLAEKAAADAKKAQQDAQVKLFTDTYGGHRKAEAEKLQKMQAAAAKARATPAPPKPKAIYYYAERTVMCVNFPGGPQNGLTVACGGSGNYLGGYVSDAAFLATQTDCKARKLGVFNVERSGARYYGCGFGHGAFESREDAMKLYPNFIPNRTIFACDAVQLKCDRLP
jgi:hypothetical protein